MTFGENLQFLRKRAGLTQEDLAEKMEVSRQSVSKWESNSAYPEMDAIIRLCGLFHCDMDTLLRGDVSRRFGEDAAAWDRHMNAFAAAIAAGVALVLLGVTLMVYLAGNGDDGRLGAVIFFAFIIAAVTLFITFGMSHGAFLRRHPGFVPCYTGEEMERFERRFPFLIAVPVALILLGVLAVIAMTMLNDGMWDAEAMDIPDRYASLAAAVLLLCITIAASALTWAGIQHSKYGFPEEESTPAQRRVARVWGFGMVAATALYVGLGLGLDLWAQAAPVIYPVAALLCVAITILLKKDGEP